MEAGIVMRVFAGQIGLSPAEYAEVELGIVRSLGKDAESKIVETLELTDEQSQRFAELLTDAIGAPPLSLEDIYSREQLEPVRTRSANGQLDEKTRTELLDAVFTPLS